MPGGIRVTKGQEHPLTKPSLVPLQLILQIDRRQGSAMLGDSHLGVGRPGEIRGRCQRQGPRDRQGLSDRSRERLGIAGYCMAPGGEIGDRYKFSSTDANLGG